LTPQDKHHEPSAHLTAQKLLDRHKARGRSVDLDIHEKAVERVARALAHLPIPISTSIPRRKQAVSMLVLSRPVNFHFVVTAS